jgi:VWFA-related protein
MCVIPVWMRRASVLSALSVALCAQQSDPQAADIKTPAIKTNVPLVIVPVTVTDKKGRFIDGLDVEDFIVSDGGVRQKIRLDTSDTVMTPVSMVIAIQSSGISQPALAKIRKVGGMIQPLITGQRGQAAVVTYDNAIDTLQDFTADGKAIHAAFQGLVAHTFKTSRLIDAVVTTIEMLEERPESRRILLILGESRDRGSTAKLAYAVERAQRAGVTVYFATYSATATAFTSKPEDNPALPMGPDYIGGIVELARMGKTNQADALTRGTGGQHLSFNTLEALEKSIAHAGEEIHSQYLLSFQPSESKNKGYHAIGVSVTARPDAIVRARPGYWP